MHQIRRMRARFAEDQELLRRSAAEFFASECPVTALRRDLDAHQGRAARIPADTWKRLAELGWLGLALPVEHGGGGLGLVELAIALEEAGRVLLPGPFLATSVFGGLALARVGRPEQQRALLPRIADGSLRVGFALAEGDGGWDPARLALGVQRRGGALELRGEKRFALDAELADLVLVAARDEDGAPAAWLVPTAAPGLALQPTALLDPTRSVAALHFDGVHVDADMRLGDAGAGVSALEGVLDLARVALSAEACGGARRALELALAHARAREQFGRPIGSFQAIQHKCADMLVRVETAVSAAYTAAFAVEHGEPDAHASACLAKATCADAFRRVAGDAIQIYGGLGFTWEQDPQLYYKRARSTEALLGDGAWHYELAARVLLDG